MNSVEKICSIFSTKNFKVSPLKGSVFGVQVTGPSLSSPVSTEIQAHIQKLVTESRLVVFRDQGIVPGKRQVEISTWFGPLESTFYKHPMSPDPDVFRVSNDPVQGCTNVGRTGMHVDGSFQPSPFSHALYHIINCPSKGDTIFLPLKEFLETMPADYRGRLERLHMCSDRRHTSAKPVVYKHPITGQDTMCFHLGMIGGFIWDKGSTGERFTDPRETAQLLKELESTILDCQDTLWYKHRWQPGDFIISDNVALAHEASIETQLDPSIVGLRVMHRTTTTGYASR